MTDTMTPNLFAAIQHNCGDMNEHASAAYWLRSEGRDASYHLKVVDQAFRKLADKLGYRVEKIEPVEVVSGADFRGEKPALQSAVLS